MRLGSNLVLAMLLATPPTFAGASPDDRFAICSELSDAGRFREALPACRDAVRRRREAKDLAHLGEALNRLGLALEMLGEKSDAKTSYDEALALHRAHGQKQLEALVLSNLAALAIGEGDYGSALRRLAEEESVAVGASGETWVDEELRVVAQNRAVTLEHLGAYREALTSLRRLAEEEEPDPGIAAALDVNLAVLYRNLGDPRHALRLLDRAASFYEERRDLSALANLALNRGLVQDRNLRSPGAAEEDYREALRLAARSGDRGEEVRARCALGELLLADGRLVEAREELDRCLSTSEAAEARETRWTALAALGRLERARGNAEGALARLREAIAVIEQIGEGSGSSQLKGSFLAERRAVYAAAVDLLAERAGHGANARALEALALAERAKARELLDVLAAGTGQPSEAPALAALGRERGPLIAYFAGEKVLWRWLLDADGASIAPSGDVAETFARVTQVHRSLARGAEPDPQLLRDLAAQLLPPHLPTRGELRIAPDGRLFYLPFDLLPDPARPSEPLIENHAISYSPSLSILSTVERARGEPALRLLALADPKLPELSAANAGTASILAARFGLARLPAAEIEAWHAAERLGEPSRVATGAAATETELREQARRGARVLHLAAHTVIDEELLDGVALFLAADSANDGFVTSTELAHMPLSVDLAVLAGCRTALGARGEGRALASLSGALLGAGVRGVVASLWEVGDRGTAALMEQFYDGLARGLRPSEALREAKLRLREATAWRSPSAWAGFVLIGDAPALPVSFRASRALLAGLGFAALGAAAYLWRRSLN